MLQISPESFLKSSGCLGDPWMDRCFGSCGFRLGLLFPCLADRLREVGRLSARSCSSRCSSCSLRVRVSLHFDPSSRWFSFGGSWPDSPRGSDRPRCSPRLSVIQGALLEVRFPFSDRPPVTRGSSARTTPTVRLVPHRVAKSFACCVSPSL
jgi:hypothetical protein